MYTMPNEQRESVHSTCPRERTTSALVLLYSSLEGATEAALPINQSVTNMQDKNGAWYVQWHAAPIYTQLVETTQ